MSEFHELLQGSQLITVEIIYHLPDFPELLQSFVWQDYDMPPAFPKLHHFLHFWSLSIDGRLHSVNVCCADPLKISQVRIADFEGTIH